MPSASQRVSAGRASSTPALICAQFWWAWVPVVLLLTQLLNTRLFRLSNTSPRHAQPFAQHSSNSTPQLCAAPAVKGNPHGTHRPPITSQCTYHGEMQGTFQRGTPKPRYIVIGGAGFVGSHLVKRLAAAVGAGRVKVLENFWSGALPNLQHDNGSWPIDPKQDVCALELRNASDTLRFIRGADYVYYMADAFHGDSDILTNVVHAVAANGIENFVYVGTAGCSTPDVAQLRARAGSSRIVVLQLHTVYGPGPGLPSTGPAALLHSLLYNVVKQQPLSTTEGANLAAAQSYESTGLDYVYIDDAVDALLLARDKGSKQAGHKTPVEVGTGKTTTKQQLMSAVVVAAAAHAKQQQHPGQSNSMHRQGASTSEPGPASVAGDGWAHANTPAGNYAQQLLGWQPKTGLQQGIQETLQWMAANKEKKRALVILYGQPRGGELAWKSLHRHLLVPLNAHLASYLIDADNAVVNQTLLYNISHWAWRVPGHKDWGVVMDQAVGACQSKQPGEQGEWQQLCDVPGEWVGGWKRCKDFNSHTTVGSWGSAGLQQSYRWLVNQLVLSLNLDKQYNVFVYTRPDHLYLCDHPTLTTLDTTSVWVPSGEEYGGVCDRHAFGSAEVMLLALNTTQELVCFPKKYTNLLSEKALHQYKRCNPPCTYMVNKVSLEMVLYIMWQEMGLRVQQFPRTAFTVRLHSDPSSFTVGKPYRPLRKYNIKIKYPRELQLSRLTCNQTDASFEQHLAYLHAYKAAL